MYDDLNDKAMARLRRRIEAMEEYLDDHPDAGVIADELNEVRAELADLVSTHNRHIRRLVES